MNPHVAQRQREVAWVGSGSGSGGGGVVLVVPTQRCAAAVGTVAAACGVSSFGFSGTIAHALLLCEPSAHAATPTPLPPLPLRTACVFLGRHFSWRGCGVGASTDGVGGRGAGVGYAGAGTTGTPKRPPDARPPFEIRSPAEVHAELTALVGGLMVGGGTALSVAGGSALPLEAHGLDSLDLLTVRDGAMLDTPCPLHGVPTALPLTPRIAHCKPLLRRCATASSGALACCSTRAPSSAPASTL